MLPGIQNESSPIFVLSRGAISTGMDPEIPSEINHEITLRISTETRPGFFLRYVGSKTSFFITLIP